MWKAKNLEAAVQQDKEYWERIALILGWPEYQLEIETAEEKKEKRSKSAKKGSDTRKKNKKREKELQDSLAIHKYYKDIGIVD